MVCYVLELQDTNIERVHRVGDKNNERNTPKMVVAKFSSYKDKQTVLSVAKSLKKK